MASCRLTPIDRAVIVPDSRFPNSTCQPQLVKPDRSNSKRDHSVWKWRERRKKERGKKGEHTFTYLYPAANTEGPPAAPLEGQLLHFDSKGTTVEPSAAATDQLVQFRPHSFTSSSVTLVEMLDVFRDLDDPQSRVFGGVFFGDAWKTRDDETEAPDFAPSVSQDAESHFPLFSGVASPGSRVDVVLADEAGVPHSELTVYTDAGGNWVAPFENVEKIEASWLAEIEIQPAAWSGMVETRNFIIPFPGGDILEHEDVQTPADGELYGVVFATGGEVPGSEPSFSW